MVAFTVGQDIGQEQTFYAHSGILCKLDFFRNILIAAGKNSSEAVTTNMPKDTPQAVLALIEYLYTGTYHIEEGQQDKQVQEELCQGPAGDARVAFHLGVYEIATKYSCHGLSMLSQSILAAIIKDSPYDISRLRLLKIAYSASISSIIDDLDVDTAKKWIRKLLEENCDELREFIQECPEFSCWILKVLTNVLPQGRVVGYARAMSHTAAEARIYYF